VSVMRFTIIDNEGTISFVAPWNTLKALVAGCSAKPAPTTHQELLEKASKYDARLSHYVFNGLSVFDEHHISQATDSNDLNPTLDAQLAAILQQKGMNEGKPQDEELEALPDVFVPETIDFSDLAAYQQKLSGSNLKEHPILRVVDNITRQESLEPVKIGLVIFNLPARRIVQVQNSLGILRRSDRGRYYENGQPTERLYFYRLPDDWSMVP
jgi:hypothetical protein